MQTSLHTQLLQAVRFYTYRYAFPPSADPLNPDIPMLIYKSIIKKDNRASYRQAIPKQYSLLARLLC